MRTPIFFFVHMRVAEVSTRLVLFRIVYSLVLLQTWASLQQDCQQRPRSRAIVLSLFCHVVPLVVFHLIYPVSILDK